MKGFALFIVLFLLFGLAAAICGAISMPRLENVAIYALDSHYAAQQNPVNVLERQMDAMQATSPSNAPGFPWFLVVGFVGVALLLVAQNYERILATRAAYLKEKTKHDRAKKTSQRPQPRTLSTLTPVRPLNPYNFQPAPAPPAALPPASTDEDDDKW
jgi:hypothetical protein